MLKDVEGIVLRSMKYRETGRILKVFTKEYGILSVMAHGVEKKNSGLASRTEPFVFVRYDLKAGRNFYYLQGAEILSMNLPLRKSYSLLLILHRATRFLMHVLPEGEPQGKLYELYKEFLMVVQREKYPARIFYAFLLQVAEELGYRPMLHSCTSCGNRKIQAMTFSMQYGGILCERCRIKDVYSLNLSKEQYIEIYTFIHSTLTELTSAEKKEILTDVGEIIVKFIEHTFQIDMNNYAKK